MGNLESKVGNAPIPAKNDIIYPESVNEILGVIFPLNSEEKDKVYTQPEQIRFY